MTECLAPVRVELGHLPVQKLTRRHIDELVRRLRDGQVVRADGTKRRPWSARSCNYLLGTLSQVLGQLVHDGTLVRNVVAHVDRVAGKPKKFATYTPMQVERLLRAIRKDRNRHAWHLALSGLRRAEIGGLRWTNIDFEAKTLTIGPTRISVDGKAVEQVDAKSEDSNRVLPVPEPLLVELKAAKKRQLSEKRPKWVSTTPTSITWCATKPGSLITRIRCPRCGPTLSPRPVCPESGCTTHGIPAVPRCTCRAYRPQ